jgi:CDP-glucose 4,6-dehydratase
VEDGAAAYAFLAEHLATDHAMAGEAFNFSNEQPINVLELTNLILKLMDSRLEPDVKNDATNEIKRQYLSAAKARTKLGWKPLFQLEEGLKHTIEWYRDFFKSKQ